MLPSTKKSDSDDKPEYAVMIKTRAVPMKFLLVLLLVTTMFSTTRAIDEMVDKNKLCGYWASRGECDFNPDYMLKDCNRSCSEMVDLNKLCGYWASRGECDFNRDYMLKNCNRSCSGIGDCWWEEDKDTYVKPPKRYSSTLDVGDYIPILRHLHSYEDPFYYLGRDRFNLVFPSASTEIQRKQPFDKEAENELQKQVQPQELIVVSDKRDAAFRRLFTTDGLNCDGHVNPSGKMPHLLVKVGLNMKISDVRWFESVADLQDCPVIAPEPALRSTPDKPYSPPPPILVVPNAIDPELAQDLIEHMDAARMKENDIEVIVDDWAGKRRNTIFLQPRDSFTERIDDKLSKSVYPEIEKVFFYQVNAREDWRIGRYTGENKGNFDFHRDTREGYGYRRFAISILLTDEYEGGGLSFLEYSDEIINLPRYSALVFPATLLHQVQPIQSGLRYVIIGFLFNTEHHPSGQKSFNVEVGRDTRGLEMYDLGMKQKPWDYQTPF